MERARARARRGRGVQPMSFDATWRWGSGVFESAALGGLAGWIPWRKRIRLHASLLSIE